MLGLDVEIGPGCKALPEHMGGALHGFVEGALTKHADHLLPLLRPEGNNQYPSLAIEPPLYGHAITDNLRFGVILFRDATQSWNVIARALVAQCSNQINDRAVRIERAWMYQPGSPMQPAISDGRMVDPAPWPESPAAWIRRCNTKSQGDSAADRVHTLEFRSPTLIGSRGAIRRDHNLPWPSLKKVLTSIVGRMSILEPELVRSLGVDRDWKASVGCENSEPLIVEHEPARKITWEYRGYLKPGLVGTLTYAAKLNSVEVALLEWGQWLGVGQQTSMGCGRYLYSSQ